MRTIGVRGQQFQLEADKVFWEKEISLPTEKLVLTVTPPKP